mmetsp:Transcript_32981/g.53508  ORF Transcript_32981/g.53508 Transcript_32981/m.53508 type:complete len:420 (-) Transcript_32981:605-1864(-)
MHDPSMRILFLPDSIDELFGVAFYDPRQSIEYDSSTGFFVDPAGNLGYDVSTGVYTYYDVVSRTVTEYTHEELDRAFRNGQHSIDEQVEEATDRTTSHKHLDSSVADVVAYEDECTVENEDLPEALCAEHVQQSTEYDQQYTETPFIELHSWQLIKRGKSRGTNSGDESGEYEKGVWCLKGVVQDHPELGTQSIKTSPIVAVHGRYAQVSSLKWYMLCEPQQEFQDRVLGAEYDANNPIQSFGFPSWTDYAWGIAAGPTNTSAAEASQNQSSSSSGAVHSAAFVPREISNNKKRRDREDSDHVKELKKELRAYRILEKIEEKDGNQYVDRAALRRQTHGKDKDLLLQVAQNTAESLAARAQAAEKRNSIAAAVALANSVIVPLPEPVSDIKLKPLKKQKKSQGPAQKVLVRPGLGYQGN